jgi:hypothetical protein
LAIFQSCITLYGEIFSTSAVSSTLRPPKNLSSTICVVNASGLLRRSILGQMRIAGHHAGAGKDSWRKTATSPGSLQTQTQAPGDYLANRPLICPEKRLVEDAIFHCSETLAWFYFVIDNSQRRAAVILLRY